MEEKLIHKLSVKIIPWQRNTTGNLSMQWRAAFNKLTNIFHTLYQVALVGSPTPTRTVCVPFSPSFSHSSWRLLVRRHAHPGQQRVRRRALLFHTQGPPGSLTHHLLLLKHIVIVCLFFTYRVTAGDNSSSARRRGTRACAVLPRHTSCSEGSVCLRSICPAVTRSG